MQLVSCPLAHQWRRRPSSGTACAAGRRPWCSAAKSCLRHAWVGRRGREGAQRGPSPAAKARAASCLRQACSRLLGPPRCSPVQKVMPRSTGWPPYTCQTAMSFLPCRKEGRGVRLRMHGASHAASSWAGHGRQECRRPASSQVCHFRAQRSGRARLRTFWALPGGSLTPDL